MYLRTSLAITAALAGLLSVPAQAQTYLRITAGTGFVINERGDLITNAHVVRGCESINVLTPQGERAASIRASNKTHDLAVLQVTDFKPQGIAKLRWNISDLAEGDEVNVLGYPDRAGITGQHSFQKTHVTSLTGTEVVPDTIQLAQVTRLGNSGGPVLDAGANVIAVVSRSTQTLSVDKNGAKKLLEQSDAAIPLAHLQRFLKTYRIAYYEAVSGLVSYSDAQIEAQAASFTFPVRCVRGKATMPKKQRLPPPPL